MTNESECEEIINGLRGRVSTGQLALEALDAYLTHELAPPQWVLEGIADCYDRFKSTRASSGWVNSTDQTPRTLGEAFEIPDHKGHLSTLRLRAAYAAKIANAFEVLGASRTQEGRELVAKSLGLTEKQVRTILPKTRKNVKGHKPYKTAISTSARANDPFSLAVQKNTQ